MFSIELFIIGIISLSPIFLNRLRGTGLIKQIFTLSFKQRSYLNLSKGLENQEVVYGIIQFVCITLTILIYKVYNGI